MTGFGGPEGAGRRHARGDAVTFAAEQGDEPFGHGALFGRGVEDFGAVLVADVGPLAVDLRRGVDLEEEACERFVGDLRRIEGHAHRFGVSRGMAAHLLVGRAVGAAAGVTRFDREDAGLLFQQVFHAPETTAGEDRRFGRGGRLGGGPVGRLRGRHEVEREGVDAVARILVGKAFTREDMPQMRPAAGAGDLGAAAVGVGRAAYRTCDLVVEGGPAAPRIELVLRTVERRAALAAAVEAALAVLVVFSREGSLGSLVDDDPAFVGCERFHGLCIYREENSHEGDSPCDDSFHNALSDVQQSRRARPTTAILRLARRRGQPRSAAPCPRTWPAW